MGFRSTFTVYSINTINIPVWFGEKYHELVFFGDWQGTATMPIHPRKEAKTYMAWSELPEDIQKVLNEPKNSHYDHWPFVLVYLHECGGITRVLIYKDRIEYQDADFKPAPDEETWGHGYHCDHFDRLKKTQ